MRWANPFLNGRSVRFRLTAAFTLAALLAAALTIAGIIGFWTLALHSDLDRSLRLQWEHLANPQLLDGNRLPAGAMVAHLAPDGRTVLSLSAAAKEDAILFMKPHYGRRGDKADKAGFWRQTVETGTPKRHFRICAKRLPDGSILAVAQDLQSHNFIHRQLLWSGLGAFLLMALLLLLFASLVAHRLFRGFDSAVATVDAMAAGDFSCRLPPLGKGEEFERLGAAINTLAGNTEELLDELRSVTDNIAHDLRTPITRLRTRAELALYTHDTATLAEDVAEECNTMLELISALLEIARIGHNIDVMPGQETDLSALTATLEDCYLALAEEKDIRFTRQSPPQPLTAYVAAPLLRRALANLLDNAFKFTPPGGQVALSLTCENGRPTFRVKDNGCGIPAAEQSFIFNRFYRADGSRATPGFGLGLALVAAIAKALGGEVALEASTPGQGSTFRLTLPPQK